MKVFVKLLSLVIIIVVILYLIGSILLTDYIKIEPNLAFICLSFFSFLITLIILYSFKIYNKDYELDKKSWKNYWNSADLVYLTLTLLTLFVGMGSYIDKIDLKAYDANEILISTHLGMVEKQERLTFNNAILALNKAEKFCKINTYNFIKSTCSSFKSLNKALTEYNFETKKIETTLSQIYDFQYSQDTLDHFNLQYLLFIFSNGNDSSYEDEFWRSEIQSYFNSHFITTNHKLQYARNIAKCSNEVDDYICNAIDALYVKDREYIKRINSRQTKIVLDKLKSIQQNFLELLPELILAGGERSSNNVIANFRNNLFLKNELISNYREKGKEISNLPPQKIKNISLTIKRLSSILSSILPLLFGATIGLRFAKGIAAFKLS